MNDAREKWLRGRTATIGASEVSAVLGLSRWKSPYALWAEKTGLAEPVADETDAQRWGNLLEDAICEEYAVQTGRKVIDHGRFASQRSKTCAVLSCTLDREVEAFDERGPGVMDAKNVGPYKDAEWDGQAPLIYQIQIQAQLEVTGYKWGSLAVLIGGQRFRWIDVERDDAFIAVMRKKCIEFWNLVETRTPPAVDGSESTSDALRQMFPVEQGEAVALPGESLEWDEQIKAANAAIKEAEERKREAQNKIIAAIGENAFGVLPCAAGRFSFKQSTRKGFTVEPTVTRTLRRLSK